MEWILWTFVWKVLLTLHLLVFIWNHNWWAWNTAKTETFNGSGGNVYCYRSLKVNKYAISFPVEIDIQEELRRRGEISLSELMIYHFRLNFLHICTKYVLNKDVAVIHSKYYSSGHLLDLCLPTFDSQHRPQHQDLSFTKKS